MSSNIFEGIMADFLVMQEKIRSLTISMLDSEFKKDLSSDHYDELEKIIRGLILETQDTDNLKIRAKMFYEEVKGDFPDHRQALILNLIENL